MTQSAAGRASTSSLQVPYVNLPAQHAAIREQLLAAVGRVLDHGRLILGPEVTEFERRFADLCRVEHAVGVGSGTAAIALALRALDIGEGDEVITAPNSFIATAAAIERVGARPVFVDVADDADIDAALIPAAITARTRAIMPVHLSGRVAKMDAILDLAERHGLLVIEDAAQAVGAEHDGRRAGGLGVAGCFSLHPLKNLGATGDAGVVTTSDAGLARKLRLLRNHGLRDRDHCDVFADNSRLDTVQAAMLLVKLNHLHAWTEARRRHAAAYRRELAELVRVPGESRREKHVYHSFTIETGRREELRDHLAARGIETKVYYPVPIHLQGGAAHLGYQLGDFPVAERQAERILSLPVYPELTDAQRDAVIAAVREFFSAKR